MKTRQTSRLDQQEPQVIGLWAADCAEHVLPYFEAKHPQDDRPRKAIEAARAWVRGEIRCGEARAAALAAHAAARDAVDPAPAQPRVPPLTLPLPLTSRLTPVEPPPTRSRLPPHPAATGIRLAVPAPSRTPPLVASASDSRSAASLHDFLIHLPTLTSSAAAP